jgi:hypothetical protein
MKTTAITIATTLLAFVLPLAAAAQHHHGMHADTKSGKPATANDPVFTAYEEVRQALIAGEVPDIRKATGRLGSAAKNAGQHQLAALAADLEDAGDLTTAREAFAAVSKEAVKYRESRCCDRPAVAYCSMEDKEWMQPDGEIGNPYVDAAMRKCGKITSPAKEADHEKGGHAH